MLPIPQSMFALDINNNNELHWIEPVTAIDHSTPSHANNKGSHLGTKNNHFSICYENSTCKFTLTNLLYQYFIK